MNTTKLVIIACAVSFAVGSAMTHRTMTKEYNRLVDKSNMLLERDKIKTRVFNEILPQIPDGYSLSEQTMIDIKSWTMFANNDL